MLGQSREVCHLISSAKEARPIDHSPLASTCNLFFAVAPTPGLSQPINGLPPVDQCHYETLCVAERVVVEEVSGRYTGTPPGPYRWD